MTPALPADCPRTPESAQMAALQRCARTWLPGVAADLATGEGTGEGTAPAIFSASRPGVR